MNHGDCCDQIRPDWKRPDPGPGVMTMQWTLKPDIPQLLTQHSQKINGLCIMLEQWKAFSHPPKILSLSHLSQFCSSPRPHNQPCVVTPGLELQSPCVRTLDSIQSQPPVWSYPLSSHVIPAVLLNSNFDNCSPIVNERWSANWWFSLNDVELWEKDPLFVSCPQSTQGIWRCQIPHCCRRVMIYCEKLCFYCCCKSNLILFGACVYCQ